MRDADLPLYFRLFNEVGIIEQLGRAMFEARLPDGVLQSQFAVLNHLMRVQDGQTPLELARAFQMPKTTMTHVLGQVEKRGWVEMRPNPGDKRSKQVWTTDVGRAFRNDAIGRMAVDMAPMTEAFPADKIAPLVEALAEIRVWLDQQR